MIRPVITEVSIFLIPFALYALFLLASRQGVIAPVAWPMPVVVRLTIAALVLVIVSLVLLAQFSGAPPGATYVPAHIENGKFMPGVER
jgi:ABC-type proline/glycine betaine transport system permease subunit